jgi:hypothetical protein
MRNIILKSLPFLALAAIFSMGAPQWKPLFNGTSFSPGWHIAGAQNYWSIDPVDSAIVGFSTTSTPYTMVFSDSLFDQFTIKYSYRLRAGCSGFFFRSEQTTATELVRGTQIEAKFASNKQSEVGSLYNHPSPGWTTQHSQAYSDRIARTPSTVYQDVVLTVKRPYFYVNVNGYQAVGETDPAELALGAKAAWQYVSTNANFAVIQNPGRFGLQIHGGQTTMDVRFKNIAILEGCGDTASAQYDGAFVAGLPKHPAVYRDNGGCVPAAIDPGSSGAFDRDASRYLSRGKQVGSELVVSVLQTGASRFEIVSPTGRVVFSVLNPAAKEYRIPLSSVSGIYLARLQTNTSSIARRIVVL